MRDRDFTLVVAATLVTLALLWAPVLMAQAPSGTKQFDPTNGSIDAAITRSQRGIIANFLARGGL